MATATEEVLGVKIESSYGVDSVPTAAANAIMVEDLDFTFADARMHERNPVKPTFGALGDLYAGALIEITGRVEIKGSGVAGTPPEIDPILRACGAKVVNVPVTSDTYSPVSPAASQESVSCYLWEGGLLYKVLGCRGLLTGLCDIGQPGFLEFALKGHFSGPTDVALPTPTFNATAPEVTSGMPFTAGGFAANISGLSWDFGNQYGVPDDLTAGDTYGDVNLVGPRRVTGSFDPLATLVATKDWVGEWQANTVGAITTGTIGSTPGNRWNLTFAQAQLREIGRGDNAGIRKREIGFLARENTGDDEWSLVFT